MEILKFQNIRPTQIRIYQMIKSKKNGHQPGKNNGNLTGQIRFLAWIVWDEEARNIAISGGLNTGMHFGNIMRYT